MWKTLDPEGKYEKVYNRYGQVVCIITNNQTQFELMQADIVKVLLNEDDLTKTGVKYILSSGLIKDSNHGFILRDKVERDNLYIYEVR